jgi:hypothetical protein
MTPADLATALDVYRSTGTWAAAARAVGRDESTVRRALRRDAPTRSTLMREALDDAQWNALRAVNLARRRVVAALQVADDPRDVATLAHAAHDGLRAVTVARAADARLYAGQDGESIGPDARDELVARFRRMTDAQLEAEIERLSAPQVVILPALDGEPGATGEGGESPPQRPERVASAQGY